MTDATAMPRRRAGSHELAALECPLLMIRGDEDAVIPPFAADAIARGVPGSRVVHVADAGHSVYFERAPAFDAALSAFVAELPGSASRPRP